MLPLPLLSIEHMCTTQDSLKYCGQQSLLPERRDLCLMMEVPLAAMPNWSFQSFQWTMRKRKSHSYQSDRDPFANPVSARAALILGPKSEWVCPSCLVPKGFLWDLSDVIYPLRTRNGTLRLIEKADACDTKHKAYNVLLEQSIRNIPVCTCLEGL